MLPLLLLCSRASEVGRANYGIHYTGHAADRRRSPQYPAAG